MMDEVEVNRAVDDFLGRRPLCAGAGLCCALLVWMMGEMQASRYTDQTDCDW